MKAPPGPFRPGWFRSPLRGPWLTALLGSLLLVLVAIVAVTGFLSHAAYGPNLGMNQIVPRDQDLDFLLFDWPTSPSWLYALNQGLHVTVGFVAVPFLLAKLWSVIPKLFAWPPATSPAQALERLSIALLVGSALFQFATGIANAQLWYPFRFNFVQAHYLGAIVFVVSLVLHVALKIPLMRQAYREQGVLRPLREDVTGQTLSRRGLLGLVGGGGLLTFLVLGGQSIGGPLRGVALLAPRRQGFPVNKTARAAGVTAAMAGPEWALELVVDGEVTTRISRQDLLQMPQRRERLPIACVEGWSTMQTWTGVRISDLARAAGRPDATSCFVESLQPRGVLREATLNAGQVQDERSLLALAVDDADLSMDHGFPARIIVPALPGVHNTKWVARMTFA